MDTLFSIFVLVVEIILGVVAIFILFCLGMGILGVAGWGIEKFTNSMVKHWKIYLGIATVFYVGLALYSCLLSSTAC